MSMQTASIDRRLDDPRPARLRVATAAREQLVFAVEFRSPGGQTWNAVGGGATLAAAIDYARESCPDDATWDAVGWNDLYGV